MSSVGFLAFQVNKPQGDTSNRRHLGAQRNGLADTHDREAGLIRPTTAIDMYQTHGANLFEEIPLSLSAGGLLPTSLPRDCPHLTPFHAPSSPSIKHLQFVRLECAHSAPCSISLHFDKMAGLASDISSPVRWALADPEGGLPRSGRTDCQRCYICSWLSISPLLTSTLIFRSHPLLATLVWKIYNGSTKDIGGPGRRILTATTNLPNYLHDTRQLRALGKHQVELSLAI